jgi:glycosyltransferase involved in cell wall biosynthesis
VKVCYWGTYDSGYPRNVTLIAGLRKNGAEVVELHEPLWRSTREKLARASAGWFAPGLILRWLGIYFRLGLRLFGERGVDCVVVGYSGHFDMFPAWLLCKLRGVPLVFDAFLSLYEAFVFDRPAIKRGSPKARLLWLVDKHSCALADTVLMDTDEHIKYFCAEFGLRPALFRRSFIGASEDRYFPRPAPSEKNPFTVLHFGRYIPLHGLKYIVRAAAELQADGVRFRFIGDGEELESTLALARKLGLKNSEFIEFMPPDELVGHIAAADVCLGVFGDTEKASRVIPNKVYEAMAMRRPVITGKSPAADELLTDGENCLLTPMADAGALAAAVRRLKADPALAERLAEAGHRLYLERASARALGAELVEIIKAG